jgi:peptidoglycan/LPS O-acetylase OafA/YrhL
LWAAVFAALLFPEHPAAKPIRAFLTARPMQHLGRISYSTYLIHMVVIYLSMDALARLSPAPFIYALALTPMTFGLTYAASLVLYRWVEAPGHQLGARLGERLRLAQFSTPSAAERHEPSQAIRVGQGG